MNTTELRESFKHIHAYQDWQRQCEQLADTLDTNNEENRRLHFELETIDLSHRDLAYRLAQSGRDNERLTAELDMLTRDHASLTVMFNERSDSIGVLQADKERLQALLDEVAKRDADRARSSF